MSDAVAYRQTFVENNLPNLYNAFHYFEKSLMKRRSFRVTTINCWKIGENFTKKLHQRKDKNGAVWMCAYCPKNIRQL